VIVFLDTSPILAACWSTKGLSHVLIEFGPKAGWRLITADYCVAEVDKNVHKHPSGSTRWKRTIQPSLEVVGSIYVIDRPIVFDAICRRGPSRKRSERRCCATLSRRGNPR
jgi:hypothetical protein